MITHESMTEAEYTTDSELVSRTLAGDRDAFNRIVSRYQILICSLAYSRIGHLGQSEDVAQETFITAWKRLRLLREPEKLRAWLCGIVRNRANKCLQHEGRQPVHDAEPLDAIVDSASPEALPSEQTISHEEETLLWRALERMPEIYREPLILYYREHKSIEHVAAELDLSEDAVKQRLSRGRKLLNEEIEVFVEKTLRRTAPTPAFSNAVLAALPLTGGPIATAGAGAAGKGGVAAKSILMACLLPFIGIFSGFGAAWLMYGRGSHVTKLRLAVTWGIVLGIAIGGQAAVQILGQHFNWSDPVLFASELGFWFVFYMALVTWIVFIYRHIQANIRAGESARTPAAGSVTSMRYAIIVAGTHFMMFWGFILQAWRAQDHQGAAIIAGLMVALAIWNFFRYRNQSMGLGYILQIASCGLVTVAIANLRMDLWLAHANGMSVAQLHDHVPFWMVSALTLVLALWTTLLLVMTKPRTVESKSLA